MAINLTALQEWQQRIDACRMERDESDEEMWQRSAYWYDTWVQQNDYVELILPRLLQRVGSTARVLEIGPGSGAFTLPLASNVEEVVAFEPSSAMQQILAQNLTKAGITNVRLVPSRFEDELIEVDRSFNLALASHSLYNVKSINMVIQGIVRLARHVFILMGSGEQRKWYRRLHRRFTGKDRLSSPHFQYFYPVLLDMGIYADVEIIRTSANYVYDSEEELIEWWMRHFRLKEDCREELGTAIMKIAERRGNHIGIFDHRRTALVQIDRERNLFMVDDKGH
jgi:2-polyprenyl-3-methyl-5-hydroxy-6-metoxy-1,4-benzoquinol methylase